MIFSERQSTAGKKEKKTVLLFTLVPTGISVLPGVRDHIYNPVHTGQFQDKMWSA